MHVDDTLTEDEPRTIGHFQLTEQIGVGAFGVVWKAYDEELDRQVAIKLPRQGDVSPEETEQFLREARAAAQLQHPNIVPVHEIGRSETSLYIVSEFIEGLTLSDWLTGHQPTAREAAELSRKLALALHHAHEKGVIHRDLKPGNVMIDRQGEPHVMDFGLAKREAGDVTITAAGQVLGTPAYMSPEQARGDSHGVDCRADVYSLGVLLFELLTGERPFRGNTRMLIHQLITEEAPGPRTLNAAVPGDLETVTLKCLEKVPANRYATAADLAEDLRRWLAGETISARPVSAAERAWRWSRRRPYVALSGLLCGLLLLTIGIGGVAVAIRESRNAKEQSRLRGLADTAKERAQRNLEQAERNAYGAEMLLVARHWEDADPDRVRDLLAKYAGRADLAGFEWDYWHRLAHNELMKLSGHYPYVWAAAYSPDGTKICSGDGRGVVRLWDAVSGRELFAVSFGGERRVVSSIAFSVDGAQIAAASSGIVNVWDAETSRVVRTFEGHDDRVRAVRFDPDGDHIVSAGDDRTVKVWSRHTGELLHTLGPFEETVSCVEFSADGSRLAVASGAGIQIRDTDSWEQSRLLTGHRADISDLAFHPDCRRVASGSGDRSAIVWDVISGRRIGSFRDARRISGVAFSPDGTRLATTGLARVVRIWDLATAREVHSLKGHGREVTDVVYSPDGSRLLTSSGDGTVRIWDAVHGQAPQTFVAGNWIRSVAVSDDEQVIAFAGDEPEVRVWNHVTGEFIHRLSGHEAGVLDLAIAGETLVSASADRTVKIWSLTTGREVWTLEGHSLDVVGVDINRDGTCVASASSDGTVRIWNAETGEHARTLPGHRSGAFSVTFDPAGTRLASGDANSVMIWNVADGRLLAKFDGHSRGVERVCFSPDGSRLASAADDGTIKVWDVAAGSDVHTLRGHTTGVNSLDFHPDGGRIVSGGRDGAVKVWRSSDGRELLSVEDHTDGIEDVAFTAHGKFLVSVSRDYTICVRDVRPWSRENQAQQYALAVLKAASPFHTPESLRARLRADSTVPAAVRERAIELAGAIRPSEDQIDSAAWRTVWSRSADAELCRLLLDRLALIEEVEPDRRMVELIRGAALFRTARYDAALEHLQASNANFRERLGADDLVATAFIVMTLHKLGRLAEAQEQWARVASHVNVGSWLRPDYQAIFLEVEQMLAAPSAP